MHRYLAVQMLSRFCFLMDSPCFWLFFLSILVYIFPHWISFYCLSTYLTLLVSIYTIAIFSDICKPPGLLSFVNFINVLFTSFSRSLIEILNKSIPKTPLQQTSSIPHLPSLPAAYTLWPPFPSRSQDSDSSQFLLDFSKRFISVFKVFIGFSSMTFSPFPSLHRWDWFSFPMFP